MPRVDIVISTPIERTPRVLQLEGLFDVPPSKQSEKKIAVNLPFEDKEWNIGAIIGPSGSGKSTILKHLFPELPIQKWDERSIVDNFPKNLSIKEVVELLSSVGFSSPPSWLKPFRVLSTGEQFRASLARLLTETQLEIAIMDEFTSVVDRTVAKIASAALARTIRKRQQQIIIASCHEDIEEWLQPDWILRTADYSFHWRSLQRRPEIKLKIYRVNHVCWNLFRQHHYLNTSLNKAAICFLATWDDRPVAFSSWLNLVSGSARGKREHRTVTLPDFQGVGIGNAVSDYCAALWRALGFRALSTTSHPSMIAHRGRSKNWKMNRLPSLGAHGGRSWREKAINKSVAISRLTAGFEYIGPSLLRSISSRFRLNN